MHYAFSLFTDPQQEEARFTMPAGGRGFFLFAQQQSNQCEATSAPNSPSLLMDFHSKPLLTPPSYPL